MISSKQIFNISEEWFKFIHGRNGDGDIYINPTITDYKEIYKKYPSHQVRFWVDIKDRKVYVWEISLALHVDVASILGKSNDFRNIYNPNYLLGYAVLKNGKFVMSGLNKYGMNLKNSQDKKYIQSLLSQDWKWISKYIDMTWFFNTFKSWALL